MWRILKAEFIYSKWLILFYLLFVPLVAVQQVSPLLEDLPASYALFWLCFVTMQNWLVWKNKNRRDNHLARLPVSYLHLALARILMLVLIWVFFWSTFSLLCIVFSADIDVKSALISLAVLLTGFAIYYVIRDHLYEFFRKHGFTVQKIAFSVVLLFLGLNVLGIFFFIRATESGRPPVSMDFIKTVARYFIYADSAETFKIIAVATIFVLISIASFLRKKSHLE